MAIKPPWTLPVVSDIEGTTHKKADTAPLAAVQIVCCHFHAGRNARTNVYYIFGPSIVPCMKMMAYHSYRHFPMCTFYIRDNVRNRQPQMWLDGHRLKTGTLARDDDTLS